MLEMIIDEKQRLQLFRDFEAQRAKYLKLDQENRTPKPRTFDMAEDYDRAIKLKRESQVRQSKKQLKGDAGRDTWGMNNGVKISKALK